MNRQAKAPVDGWAILDKPLGMTSAKATAAVKRLFGAAKAGHAGTLDPLASGVLPIALGEATKTMPFVADAAKAYSFSVRWGEARSTGDSEGEVVATATLRPTRAAIEAMLPRFVGEIEQTPPAFSAIKIAGRPAYARARAGEAVEMAPRRVRIDRLAVVGVADPDRAEFVVACGKGTYIRSLARDLAVALGTVGHVASLRRTAVGRFVEERAISLENLQRLGHIPARLAYLYPVETALDDIPALAVTEPESLRLRRGQAIEAPRPGGTQPAQDIGEGQSAFAILHGRAVAIVRRQGGRLLPARVFNLDPAASGEAKE